MRGGTLFSGIGAPEVAAPWVDWRWSADIDDFANAVRAHHWPEVPNLGDVAAIRDPEPVDIIVGGSPCQDNSVGYPAGAGCAGDGLDGARSGLAFSFARVILDNEHEWFVWENVPNVLSSRNSTGFLRFAAEFGEGGYSCAWRVLDQRCLGQSDQPRPRLFMVGNRTDPRCAAAVLLEPEGFGRNSEAGSQAAPVLTARGGMAFDDRTPCVLDEHGARIATPLEWERALGFPDDFTLIPWRNGMAPDGRRYKSLGNSMHIGSVGWVLDRIRAFEARAAA